MKAVSIASRTGCELERISFSVTNKLITKPIPAAFIANPTPLKPFETPPKPFPNPFNPDFAFFKSLPVFLISLFNFLNSFEFLSKPKDLLFKSSKWFCKSSTDLEALTVSLSKVVSSLTAPLVSAFMSISKVAIYLKFNYSFKT